jgi:hypothetical protein
VSRVATGWTTGRSALDSRQRRKDFSSSLCVQTGSGALPASCTMGTGGGPFPGAKARPRRDANHSPHLVPRSRMSRSYTSSPPKRLRGMYWDSFSFFSIQMSHHLHVCVSTSLYQSLLPIACHVADNVFVATSYGKSSLNLLHKFDFSFFRPSFSNF